MLPTKTIDEKALVHLLYSLFLVYRCGFTCCPCIFRSFKAHAPSVLTAAFLCCAEAGFAASVSAAATTAVLDPLVKSQIPPHHRKQIETIIRKQQKDTATKPESSLCRSCGVTTVKDATECGSCGVRTGRDFINRLHLADKVSAENISV